MGVTVSPVVADGFVRMLEDLEYEKPDRTARTEDGAVTAIWEDRNHFNSFASDSYRAVMDFLNGIPDDLYQYESVTEDYEPETGGSFGLNFYTYTVYEVFGEPFTLDRKAVSKNRRSGAFASRNGKPRKSRRHRSWPPT